MARQQVNPKNKHFSSKKGKGHLEKLTNHCRCGVSGVKSILLMTKQITFDQ